MTNMTLRHVRHRLLPAEVEIASAADRHALSEMIAQAMTGPDQDLPGEIPRAHPQAALTLLPDLALPADLHGRWGEASRERRAQWVRAGLCLLGAEFSAGRYVLTPLRWPGLTTERQQMSVGDGTHVARAGWLTLHGMTRRGTRPGQAHTASEIDLPGTPDPQPLWVQVDAGGQVLRVIAAPHLFAAATAPGRIYQPAVLMQREALRAGTADPTDYII